MKTYILLLSLIIATGTVFAQPAQPDHKRGQGKQKGFQGPVIGAFESELNLSEAQKGQLQVLRNEAKAKMDAIGQDNREQGLKAIRDEYRAKFLAILTPEQKAKAEELHKSHPGPGKKGRELPRT